MAVTSERVAVGTSATPLNTAGTSALRMVISPVADVDLGDSSVVSGGGYLLVAADAPLTVEVDAGDVVYAVGAVATDVHVLRT